MSTSSSLFELESLEPRILLSAELAAIAAPQETMSEVEEVPQIHVQAEVVSESSSYVAMAASASEEMDLYEDMLEVQASEPEVQEAATGIDLVISTSVTSLPDTPVQGVIELPYVITNQGDTTLEAGMEITVSGAVSKVNNLDQGYLFGADEWLTDQTLAPGESYSGVLEIYPMHDRWVYSEMLANDGQSYIILRVNPWGTGYESDITNNEHPAIPVVYYLQDLDYALDAVRAPPEPLVLGSSASFQVDLSNLGTDAATGTKLFDYESGEGFGPGVFAKVYFSADDIFNNDPWEGDVYVGPFLIDGTGSIAAGQSLTGLNLEFVPTHIEPGDYYVFVEVNTKSYEWEEFPPIPENNQTNNLFQLPGVVTVGPAEANLVLSDVVLPTGQHTAGEVITMSWTVTNTGTSEAGQGWSDYTDNTVVVPVDLHYDPADLVLVDAKVVSGTVETGSTIMVEWTVRNDGLGTAYANWYDSVYLSHDAIWDSSDSYLSYQYQYNDLAPGESYTRENSSVILPTWREGSYLIFEANAGNSTFFGEADRANNYFALPISYGGPDFTVVIDSVTPLTTGGLDAQATVNYTVTNNGERAPASSYWWDAFYLSQDAVLDSSDIRFNEQYQNRSNFLPGSSYQGSYTFNLSESLAPGTWYLIVKADYTERTGDADYTNNAAAGAVTLGMGNLAVDSFTWGEGQTGTLTAPRGGTVEVDWQVTNNASGTVAADLSGGSWYDFIYLSTDPVWDASDTQFASRYQSPASLLSGESYTDGMTLYMPNAPPGAYYLILRSDAYGNVLETNESDNYASIAVVLTAPDLEPITFTAPESVVLGATLPISWTVENKGDGPMASGWYDLIRVVDAADWPNNGSSVWSYSFYQSAEVPAGGSYSDSHEINLNNLSAGDYWILLEANSYQYGGEAVYSNNQSLFSPLRIDAPDLTVALDAANPSSAAVHQPINISWTVTNSSESIAAPASWSDVLYLHDSTDLSIGSPVYLGNYYPSLEVPLAPGASYQAERSISLPGMEAGSYYLIIKTDRYNEQGETDEANNTASIALSIQVPDLRLVSATAPSSGSVGELIDVSWTIANDGECAAYANRYDHVYLSPTTSVTADSISLSYFYYSSGDALAAGESITNSRAVTLPSSIASGSYYLIFTADTFDYQRETSETNNRHVLPIQIYQPDLEISNIVAPADGNWGQQVSLSWTVTNVGQGLATSYWYDRVYLSADNLLDTSSDTMILSSGQWENLAAGASYTREVLATLPSGMTGEVFLIFVTDATERKTEADESNNLLVSSLNFDAANLFVTSVVAPNVIAWGQVPHISWTVENNGAGDASVTWWDAVFLSTDQVWDAGDLSLGAVRAPLGGLVAGSSYTASPTLGSLSKIPKDLGAGAMYLLFRVDAYGQQPESVETDNVYAHAVTVTTPDLVIDPATALPTSAVSGKSLNLQWVVGNTGNGTATQAWYEMVYLSDDASYDSGDRYLGSIYNRDPLASGETASRQLNVSIPSGLTGTQYLILRIDSYDYQAEFDEANNTLIQALNLSAPNLAVTGLTAPASGENGSSINISYTIENNGSAEVASGWYEWVILSRDDYYGNYDDITLCYQIFTQPLTAGESLQRSIDATLPWDVQGDYTLYVKLDRWNHVAESSESDNTATAAFEITYATPPADLQVEIVTGPATALTGNKVTLSWRVVNVGTAATTSTSWYDRVYLSTDSVYGGGDINLGDFWHSGALESGANYSASGEVTLPQDLAAGQYWLIVYSDIYNQVNEPGAEGNNTLGSLGAVAVELAPVPDLTVTTVDAPSVLVIGQTAEISWTVRNDGAASAASSWYDGLWLSVDGQTSGAHWLGSYRHDQALAAGESYTRTVTVTLPSAADGDYVFLVRTDNNGNVYERDGESNNLTASSNVNIRHPDLVVTELSTPVGTILSGDTIAVNWTIANNGSGAAMANWVNQLWLSGDISLDAGDVLLGSFDGVALAAGATLSGSGDFKLPDGVSGDFYLILNADATGTLTEGSTAEGNNKTASGAFAVQLAPYPDLVVSGVVVNGEAAEVYGVPVHIITGDPADITVSWTVSNEGNGPGRVDAWMDAVILSADAVLGNGDDRVIGQFANSGAMPAGTSYQQAEIIKLPAAFQGRYHLFVVTDYTGVVFELPDTAPNHDSPAYQVDILPRPYADLLVTEITGDLTASTGVPIQLFWTVRNDGRGITSVSDWVDTVYVADNREGTGWTKVADFTRVGNLAPGDSYTRMAEVTIPVNLSNTAEYTTARYFFVETNRSHRPYEFIHTNNNVSSAHSLDLTYTVPPFTDMRVENVTTVTEALDGAYIDVTWQVRNYGPDAAAGGWKDIIYIAPNGDRTAAITIGSFNMTQTIGAGFSYTRTESFALPKHITGIYEVYVHTDAQQKLIDPDRTNNAPALGTALTISLTPRPDLTVSTLTIPETVTAGAVIDVEWVVANLGSDRTPVAGSRWYDGVYLSLDNKLDGGDTRLALENNGAALAVNESYSNSGRYRLPSAVAGPMYILVVADVYNQIDEFPGNHANVRAEMLYVDAQPVPPPDLVVSNVAGPLEAFDGTEITVYYRVTNQGAGITYPAYWSDSLWLTNDRTAPGAGDLRIGTVSHNGALEVGEYYEGTITGKIPDHLQGQYYLTVYTDAWNQVWELTFDVNINPDDPHTLDNNNFKASNEKLTIIYTPPADLEVTAISAPATAVGSDEVTISWSVANNGSSVTDLDRWADFIYVADDAQGTNKQLLFGLLHEGALERGQSYSHEVTFTLPPSASGQFFLVETNGDPSKLLTDAEILLKQLAEVTERIADKIGDLETMSVSQLYAKIDSMSKSELKYILWGEDEAPFRGVWEGPFRENNLRAVEALVTPLMADLVVTEVSLPDSAFSGDRVDVSWTVTNQGDDVFWGTQRWIDYVYVSPDPEFIFSRASYVGSVVHVAPPLENPFGGPSPLVQGASYTATAQLALPLGAEGTRYVYVFTDRNPFVENRWGGIDSVGRGEYPNWPDIYKDRVYEGPSENKLNNVARAEMQVVYAEPDLEVTAISVPDAADSGQVVEISWTVTNNGTRDSRATAWDDRIYISRDGSLDLYDLLLDTKRHNGLLEVGESYTFSTTVRLPDDIEGEFNLLVYIDSPYAANNQVGILPYPSESGTYRLRGPQWGDIEWQLMGTVKEFQDEANNIIANPISITRVDSPDLQVTAVTHPQEAITGRRFDLEYTVTNNGAGDVPDRQNAWRDYIYLSRDPYLDVNSDHYLGSTYHQGALAQGESYSVSMNYSVPRGILGPYYVFVLTDVPNANNPRGFVYEGNHEGNNAGYGAVPMTISLAPPTDLQVDAVTLTTDPETPGVVTVDYTVSNVTTNTEHAKGYWADALYLSADAVWDLGDAFLGRVELEPDPTDPSRLVPIFRDLAPGQSYTASFTANLPVALPGDYRVIVRANIYDDINEGGSRANNRLASAQTVEVTVPVLVLDQAESAELALGGSRLFAIDVPGGETLQVSLVSSDKTTANELYVLYEDLPNSIRYDAAFEGHLWSDQKALVPLTQAGRYYILVRSAGHQTDETITTGTEKAAIEVNARLLPFSISDVSPDAGGDSRYVTLEIRGARFSVDAIVKLVRPEFAELLPVNYEVINATRIIATFDFTGTPLGLYDVQVINPDGSVAVEPYRYLVEEARPLDLTVGMGGPQWLEFGAVGWYGFGVYSLSNVDAPYVHFEFALPNYNTNAIDELGWPAYVREMLDDQSFPVGPPLIFRTNLTGFPEVDDVPWAELNPITNLNGRNMATGFTFDFIAGGYMGLTFTADVRPEMRDVLAVESNALKDLKSEDPDRYAEWSYRFYIAAAATPMTADEYVSYQLGVAEDLRLAVLDDPAAPRVLIEAAANASLWGQLYLQGLADSGQLRAEDLPPEIHTLPPISSLMSVISAGILGIDTEGEIAAGGDWATFFEQVKAWYGHTAEAYGNPENMPTHADLDLGLTHETHFESFWIDVGNSGSEPTGPSIADPALDDYFGLTGSRSDAVQIEGPNGYGNENFIPVDTWLPYSIHFENPADARYPVKRVQIYQEIDELLDVRSFTLSDIRLGDISINIPEGRGAFAGDFDFTDELGVVVRVVAGVDVVSRNALWTFTAIDPDTGLTVTEDALGLLFPNTDRTQGAQVGYKIKTMPSYTDGLEIKTGANISTFARVIYDNNAPMDTGIAFATLDAEAPVTTWTVEDIGNDAYRILIEASDALSGSGVGTHTIYVAIDGGAWQPWQRRVTETEWTYNAPVGSMVEFFVRSADLAGNVEAAPEGLRLPAYNPGINLGLLPDASTLAGETELPVVSPAEEASTNALFLAALNEIPFGQSAARPSGFSTVYEPFTVSAFAQGIPGSGAGIAALGMAFGPDGSVYVSGGAGRNLIWVFDAAGGTAGTPFAVLDTPVYDLLYASNGHLWATTGGGALLELDPLSGAVLNRYGSGVQLGLVEDVHKGVFYVATSDGVSRFNPVDGSWQGFSSTLVSGLALSPEGVLHGVTWPDDGAIVRFDARGNAEVIFRPEHAALGLAFGRSDSPLENLLFVGHPQAGQRAAIIYTIVQNCKNHGIDPQAYMVDVLERLPHMSNDPEQIRQLQPKFWGKNRAKS